MDTKLAIVEGAISDRASVMRLSVAPALKGTNPVHNLLCGGCDEVLFEGFDEADAIATFTAPHQLVIQCPQCGRHCDVPARIGP